MPVNSSTKLGLKHRLDEQTARGISTKRRRISKFSLCKVIGVGDADCFEVQISQKNPKNAHTVGFPTVVVQESGRIVSRSHEAKEAGIDRSMKVYQARNLCPDLHVIPVKKKFNKPDTTEVHFYSNKIREAVLGFRSERLQSTAAGLEKSDLPVERTGCDEFLIDLTEQVNLLIQQGCPLEFNTSQKISMEGARTRYNGTGLENRNKYFYSTAKYVNSEEIRLAYGLQLMDECCRHIFKKTGIVLSGGVGSNKVIAKLACNLHKPNAVTALTRRGFYRVSWKVKFRNVSGFGGQLGETLEHIFGDLNLLQMRNQVMRKFNLLEERLRDPVQAQKAKMLVLGICHDPVQDKLMSKGMNCGKGCNIRSKADFKEELNTLTQNVLARIAEEEEINKRITTGLKFQYSTKIKGRQSTFTIDLEAVRCLSNEEGGFDHKILFCETLKAAVTNNSNFESDCVNIIEWINFSVSAYHQFAAINMICILECENN